MKKRIIAIVGESGSGKTFASQYLQEKFGWNAIVSYTTRPMRKGEVNGRDHWFVKPSQVPPKSRMCAYTQFGGYEYWTEWNQFQILFDCVYVIDEKGLIDLMAKEQTPISFQLVTIKIKRDKKDGIDEVRQARDKERIELSDEFYDYVINNNESLEAFCASLYLTAQCIIQKEQ